MIKLLIVFASCFVILRADSTVPLGNERDLAFVGPQIRIPETLEPPRIAVQASTVPVRARVSPSVVVPSTEGIVRLKHGRSRTPPQLENPFDCRLRLTGLPELRLRVGSIAMGAFPNAVINARITVEGDRIEGFVVGAISPEGVVVERGGCSVFLPAGKTITVVEEGE
ncbi:MAG: hypothetical protein SFV32_02415 [Opitutaceae bacterium]|nr:hypothetical protein [Opitutaceae bacterium]